MSNFAQGSKSKAISDRSGMRFPYREMRKEWNGLKVGPDEYEEKHPQLRPQKTGADPQALFDPRPDQRTETKGQTLLINNPFQSGSPGSSVVTVFEPSHGRTTSSVVVFRKVESFDGFTSTTLRQTTGHSIVVVDSDSYTITISAETATTGNIRGGGGNGTVEAGVATSSASTFDSTSATLDSTNKTFDEG